MANKESYVFYKDQINIPDIIEKLGKDNKDAFEEGILICDLSDVIKKFNIWKEYLPRVSPFYAVKCNNYGPILELLANLGVGFDCASKGEIEKIKSLGVKSERIVYANSTKSISHIKYAREMNVKRLTFDNEKELYKIKEHYPDAELLIRIRCDAKESLIIIGEKFGCEPTVEAVKLMRLAKKLKLKLIGVSFHVGSFCDDFEAYGVAIEASKKVFDEAENLGLSLKLLDIGGGYPGDVEKIRKIANIVNNSIDKHFPDENITIISEPGNYFVSSAVSLITKIHSMRDFHNGSSLKKMYYINAGYYSVFCLLDHNQIPTAPIILKDHKGTLFRSVIYGPTCDSMDKVLDNIMLPELDIDDILIFPNLGSYTISKRCTFNGFQILDILNFINEVHKNFIEN